jgi:hypothetical protein
MKYVDGTVSVEIDASVAQRAANDFIEFDNALIMRNVAHEWRRVDDLYL